MIRIRYIIMGIKSLQTLVQEALKQVKTLTPEEALQKSQNNACSLIDIRDLNELEREGRIENSLHVSRPDPNPSMPMPMDPEQEHNYQSREQSPSYYEQKPPEYMGHDPLFMKRLIKEEKPLDITTPGTLGHTPAFLKKYLEKYGTPYR